MNEVKITVNCAWPIYTFLAFLGLKLAGVIGWSWWWVTAPLWIPAGASALFVAFVCWIAWRRNRYTPKRLIPKG